ncbi:hypothetical protein [Ilumatobacter sp.]|uniref:hypothetical protein n=1 Tax=Ilumatobacter sp. TaxID=1967498 RepID=UPI003B5297E2
MASDSVVVDVLLDRYGRTFAAEAGIRVVDDTPSPLFRLLCMSLLTSARISSDLALAATRALADAGWTTPDAMLDSTWEDRTRVLNDAGYGRYDESTSRYLEDTTRLLVDRYSGDLRRVRERADGDVEVASRLLREFTGIGRLGASIFLREVQVAWDEFQPFVDERALDQAGALSLPATAVGLRDLVDDGAGFARLVAALVRCGLDGAHDEIASAAAEG